MPTATTASTTCQRVITLWKWQRLTSRRLFNPLFGFASSTGTVQEAAPNTDGDSNDNGLDTPITGAIRSGTVTLGKGNSEPTAEADLGPGGQGVVADNHGNMTVDFGFYQAYSLGNRVWLDTDNSGTINGAEVGIANVLVNLLTTTGATVDNPNLTGTQGFIRRRLMPPDTTALIICQRVITSSKWLPPTSQVLIRCRALPAALEQGNWLTRMPPHPEPTVMTMASTHRLQARSAPAQ